MTQQPTFSDVERALGLRDRTHRYREAAKFGLPIGSGDTIPTWPDLAGLLFRRLVDESNRQEESIDGDLKEEKLKEEIKVLQERYRKLEMENEANEGNLVDVNELFGWAEKLASFIRKAGDLLARKNKLTGREAQEVINNAIDDFEQSTKEFRDQHGGDPLD
jgi:hypothetical protein